MELERWYLFYFTSITTHQVNAILSEMEFNALHSTASLAINNFTQFIYVIFIGEPSLLVPGGGKLLYIELG